MVNPDARSNPALVAQEQARIFDLKSQGLSTRAIAQQMGLSSPTVHRRLHAAIEALVLPAADEVRKLEIDRYDRWLHRLEGELDSGGDPARLVPVLLQVSQRRAKLLGLDAPEKVEAHVFETTQEDIALAEMLREMSAQAVTETTGDHSD